MALLLLAHGATALQINALPARTGVCARASPIVLADDKVRAAHCPFVRAAQMHFTPPKSRQLIIDGSRCVCARARDRRR